MQTAKTPKARLTFYAEERPKESLLGSVSSIHALAGQRREIHRYVERFGQIPAGALEMDQELDVAAHFALRIVSCAEKGLAEEFVAQEGKLFRLRVEQMRPEEVFRFFADEYLTRVNGVYAVEDKQIRLDLSNWLGAEKKKSSIHAQIADVEEVAVHFTQVQSIPHACQIDNGYLVLRKSSLSVLLCRGFADLLGNFCSTLYLSGAVDERFSQDAGPAPAGGASLSSCQKHFPPCMEGAMKSLKSTGHLKYQDRTHFTAFLKSIGVPMEDTIGLFKEFFKCAPDVFEREYKYRIRHIYGKEGSRIDYKGFPCARIVADTGHNGCLGCPYSKSRDPTKLCAEGLAKRTGKGEQPVLSPTEYYERCKAGWGEKQ